MRAGPRGGTDRGPWNDAISSSSAQGGTFDESRWRFAKVLGAGHRSKAKGKNEGPRSGLRPGRRGQILNVLRTCISVAFLVGPVMPLALM